MKKDNKENNIVNFPAKLSDGEREVAAILFAAAEPLDIDTIESKLSKKINTIKILEKLQTIYSTRVINLVCISNKWSFRTAKNLSNLMSQQKSVEKKLSKAAIETLAIIVYHQPVTRAEIEEIRGVAFGTNTLEILMELNWVKPQGRKDIPGKPIQYGTTDDFFGHSTAIDGNTLVVGAYGDNIGAGSAYIFEKYNNKWIQVQKITASDGESLNYFGYENIAIYELL